MSARTTSSSSSIQTIWSSHAGRSCPRTAATTARRATSAADPTTIQVTWGLRLGMGASSAMALRGLVATPRAAGCVFAEDEARLLVAAAADAEDLAALTARRVAGEPLELV